MTTRSQKEIEVKMKPGTIFYGTVLSVCPQRKFGFIQSPEASKFFDSDVWVSLEQLNGIESGSPVVFEGKYGKFGRGEAMFVCPKPGPAAVQLHGSEQAAAQAAINAISGRFSEEAEKKATLAAAPVCCFWLQKRCRLEAACVNKHHDDEDEPCSNMGKGCRTHNPRNEKHSARQRYDPVAAARMAEGWTIAPMKAIKALHVDDRPAIPPPGSGGLAMVPKYLQKRRDMVAGFDDQQDLKWVGTVEDLPPPGATRGYIESINAKREYGKPVWVPAELLGSYQVGDRVEFELVLDDAGDPQARRLSMATHENWTMQHPEMRGMQQQFRIGRGSMRCETCNYNAGTTEDLQAHYRSEEHRNTERKFLEAMGVKQAEPSAAQVDQDALEQILRMRKKQ